MWTKARLMCLFAAAAFGLCFHLGERSAEAQPPPCPNHDCKDVYGWWIGGDPGGTKCYAAKVTDSDTNTTHAITSIYATASNGKLPVGKLGTFDRYVFTNCTATCGKMGGTSQSPQEVVPTGTGSVQDRGINRLICTPKAVPGGEID